MSSATPYERQIWLDDDTRRVEYAPEVFLDVRHIWGADLAVVTGAPLTHANTIGELVMTTTRRAGNEARPRTTGELRGTIQYLKETAGLHTTSTIQRAPFHIARTQEQQGLQLDTMLRLAGTLWFTAKNWQTLRQVTTTELVETGRQLQRADDLRRRLIGEIFADGLRISNGRGGRQVNPGAAMARALAVPNVVESLRETLMICLGRNQLRFTQIDAYLNWVNDQRETLLRLLTDLPGQATVLVPTEPQRQLRSKYDIFAKFFLDYWRAELQGTPSDPYVTWDDSQVIRSAYISEWSWEQFDSFLAIFEHEPARIAELRQDDLLAMMPDFCPDPIHQEHRQTVAWYLEQMLAQTETSRARKLLQHTRRAIRQRTRAPQQSSRQIGNLWLPQAHVWMPRAMAAQLTAAA